MTINKVLGDKTCDFREQIGKTLWANCIFPQGHEGPHRPERVTVGKVAASGAEKILTG